MNIEEQLSNKRNSEQSVNKRVAKYRILSLLMLGVSTMCGSYAYQQKLEAEAQRSEVIRLYRDIKKLQQESEAARLEASKLRLVLEKNEEAAGEAKK